ncbi:MAG TPA: CoA transferase [Dehalococcoidia bacterium]|nr:CoA transferase [Dehalococcoidia bacterium]
MLALEGIRVIDLSRLAPGPYGTMLLGDLGADIIKVERPPLEGMKRLTSKLPYLIEDSDDERTMAFLATNRNKRSIILDLRQVEAREVFYKLVGTADVLLEQFRPGVVRRLGIDYDTLKGINPRLIYCSLSGYGQDGPYRDLVGHDINYIAMGGFQGMVGNRQGPAIPMNIVADYAAGGMHVAIGILAALIAREKTGRGQYLDLAMVDGVVSLLAAEVSRYLVTGVEPRWQESMNNGAVPWYNIYETKDHKYISIGCIEPHFYEQLCRVLGREDLIPYQAATGEKLEEIFSIFREIFKTKTRDEWFDIMRQADNICVGKVYSLGEMLNDPQVLHRQMIVEVDHPKFGKIKQVGISVKLSDTPGQIRGTGAYPGENSEEILRELGYSKDEIGTLKEKGAVR